VTNCLSRNFANHTGLAHFNGAAFRAEYVNQILAIDDYISFLLAVEAGPHDAVPIGLGGDFKSMTAPTDPIFFLHHSQLDRLWWIWQRMKPDRRYAYNGAASRSSNATASLEDTLFFKGLDLDVKVADIIDTQGGILCYEYDKDTITGEL
jgi:tyrosinase